MISYEEYKKLYNPQNEDIKFFDVTSWKKENYRNYLLTRKTTPNDYIAPTKLEILSQKKKEYVEKIDTFEKKIYYYNMHYNEQKLYLYRKVYVKYILKLAELEEEFEETFKNEFEKDIDLSIFKDLHLD